MIAPAGFPRLVERAEWIWIDGSGVQCAAWLSSSARERRYAHSSELLPRYYHYYCLSSLPMNFLREKNCHHLFLVPSALYSRSHTRRVVSSLRNLK